MWEMLVMRPDVEPEPGKHYQTNLDKWRLNSTCAVSTYDILQGRDDPCAIGEMYPVVNF